MRNCYKNCAHRALVEEYQWARLAWEERREAEPNMTLEDDEYIEQYPPPTFKEWLKR